jgi:hypothetical protein
MQAPVLLSGPRRATLRSERGGSVGRASDGEAAASAAGDASGPCSCSPVPVASADRAQVARGHTDLGAAGTGILRACHGEAELCCATPGQTTASAVGPGSPANSRSLCRATVAAAVWLVEIVRQRHLPNPEEELLRPEGIHDPPPGAGTAPVQYPSGWTAPPVPLVRSCVRTPKQS